jgi:hypothetical protein
MSLINVLWQNRNKLIQSFHIAIIHGLVSTWRRCTQLNSLPQEPDFVAGLVVESTPLIYSALESILASHKISVSVSAIFCHKSPQVTFSSNPTESCELGDILFAYAHTPRIGPPRRNAILFQAKASSKQPYHIHGPEIKQLHLYMEWPDFVYTRSSFLNGHKRIVTPKTPHSGAQYLLIDDRSPDEPSSGLQGIPGTYPIGCCMPDELLIDHNNLPSELFNLFIFSTGRPFEDKKPTSINQNWSQVVWDLLENGVNKSFKLKNSGRIHTVRAAGYPIQMMDGLSFSKASSLLSCTIAADIVGKCNINLLYSQTTNDIPPNNRDREGNSEGPESGVSIVLIETSEKRSEE